MIIAIEDADVDTGGGVMMRCRIFRPQDTSRRWPAVIVFAEIFNITGPIARSAQIIAGKRCVVCVPEFFHNFFARFLLAFQ
jgi:carboxymethylenebutenolidase